MSFPAYSAYKNSGDEWLSEVPEHWEVLPLKHFAEVDNSGCYGVEPSDGYLIRPVATTAQIDSEGRFDVGRMSDRGFSAQELARYECSPGDVLIVKSSGSAENIISGKAGLVREDTPPFVFSNFLMRLRYRKEICVPSFLYSLLISHLTRERIKQMCSTTTYPNLQVGLYTSAKLPCPPLAEQTQIARFLDHETARIDALIEEQQRLIELLKEKRQAVISHAVTKGLDPTVPMKDSGVEWLGEVPAHWVVSRVKNVVSFITSGPRGWSDYIDESGKDIFLQSGDMDNRLNVLFDKAKRITTPEGAEGVRTRVREGDVFVCITGANTGRVAVVKEMPGISYVNQHLGLLRPQVFSCDSRYLGYALSSTSCQTYFSVEQYGLKEGLSLTDLAEAPLMVPTIAEQVALVNSIEEQLINLDKLSVDAERTVELLTERRSALISAAVTGKIDVRGWQPPVSTQAPEPAVAEAH